MLKIGDHHVLAVLAGGIPVGVAVATRVEGDRVVPGGPECLAGTLPRVARLPAAMLEENEGAVRIAPRRRPPTGGLRTRSSSASVRVWKEDDGPRSSCCFRRLDGARVGRDELRVDPNMDLVRGDGNAVTDVELGPADDGCRKETSVCGLVHREDVGAVEHEVERDRFADVLDREIAGEGVSVTGGHDRCRTERQLRKPLAVEKVGTHEMPVAPRVAGAYRVGAGRDFDRRGLGIGPDDGLAREVREQSVDRGDAKVSDREADLRVVRVDLPATGWEMGMPATSLSSIAGGRP